MKKSGFWFVVRNLPGFVRMGLQLVTDAPMIPKLRVDPDGERKEEERRAHRRRSPGLEDMRMPRLKTTHLQWEDTSGKTVWRDTALRIDLDAKRTYRVDGVMLHFLGGGHTGSGAIGVALFAAPALLVLSPYIYARNARWRARERKEGISRHAIVLMERLAGQLDPETEALLREALKNDWKHECKMTRRVTFEEACAVLDACDLTEEHWHEYAEPPNIGCGLVWRDDEGDIIGQAESVDDRLQYCRVLGTEFEPEQALGLIGHCRSRKILHDDDA